MATLELSHITRAVAEPDEPHLSIYGPVEIVWYADRLRVTVAGAGPATLSDAYVDGDDVVVEIRPPGPEELPEFLPGAD